VLPVVLMIVFCYGLVSDVENAPFAILDHDRSALSRDYARKFMDSRYFDFKGYVADAREAERLLVDARVRMVLVVPPGFERELLEGRPVDVQTLLDGTFTTPIRTLRGYVGDPRGDGRGAPRSSWHARAGSRRSARRSSSRCASRRATCNREWTLWAIAPSMIMFI
jgi:ABC-2 type transport system permease protein/ribosome-dependent ATPase